MQMRPHHRLMLTAMVCSIASSAIASNTINLPLSTIGQAATTDGSNFYVNSPADPVYTDWTPNLTPLKERRGIFEFSLASLPDGTTIESANLQFNVAAYDSQSNGTTTLYPSVTFWGYAGNNAVDVSDATQDGNLALNTTRIDDTGDWSISLDVSDIQSLIDSHPDAIGILTYAQSQDLSVGIWSAAHPSIAAPALVLTYSGGVAPLDGDFNNDGQITLADLTILDNGFASHLTGYDNGDFNRDGVINFDDYTLFDRAFALYTQSSSSAPNVVVPEPSAAFLAIIVLCPLLARRRRVI